MCVCFGVENCSRDFMAKQYFACLDIESICIDIYKRNSVYAIPSSAHPLILGNPSTLFVLFVEYIYVHK